MAPKSTSFKLRMPSKQTQRIIGEVGAFCLELGVAVYDAKVQQQQAEAAAAAAAAAIDSKGRYNNGSRRASDSRDRNNHDTGYDSYSGGSRKYRPSADTYRESPPKPRQKSVVQSTYTSHQYPPYEQDYGGHIDTGSQYQSRQRRPYHDDALVLVRKRERSRGRY